MATHVCCQVAGLREGLTAGSAGVGTVAGMGAHVHRQVAGLRAGFATDRAFKDVLSPYPAPPPLGRDNNFVCTGRLAPSPLVSVHIEVSRHDLTLF